MNDTKLNEKRQEQFEKTFNDKVLVETFATPAHAHRVINSYAPLEKEILNALVRYLNKYKTVFPRQNTIARQVGCTREHVNRTTSKFVKDGLLIKKKVGVGACEYTFAPFLFKANFRIVLSSILTAFMGAFLLSPVRIEAQKYKAHPWFLEVITTNYIYSSLKGRISSLDSLKRGQDFSFWKEDDTQDVKQSSLRGQLCSQDTLCMICEHEQEVKRDIEIFKHEVPFNDGELVQEDMMNEAKKDLSNHKVSLTEYLPSEPYQTLQEEVEWLREKAVDEAKLLACNAICRNNLKDCAKARNNYYRLALDDIQKEWFSTDGYKRKTWQQWAMSQYGKVYICTQKSKDSNV